MTHQLNRRGFLAGAAVLGAAAWTFGAPSAVADDLSGLRSAIRGRVLLPGDPGFDAARTPWNLTVDQSVLAVAEIADADDAAALIRYARQAGVAVAAQPSGHGASETVNGTILVRTKNLNSVQLDPATRTATVGAGVSWGEVQTVAGPLGLTGVTGSSPAVGITGYTLGAGLSWFGRAHGWASESVTAFDVLDADGVHRHVTADENPDLFWALRGGGGDYAFVTSLQFELKPAAAIYGGRIVWPAAQAPAVFAAFREITATAPEQLTLWCGLSRPPGAPPMVSIDAAYLGDSTSAARLMAPLEAIGKPMADTRRMMTAGEIGSITDEPTRPSPAHQQSTLISDLSQHAIDTLLTEPMEPLIFLQVRHLGGALARPSDTPAGAVTAPYLINFGGIQPNPQAANAIDARVSRYLDELGPIATNRTPFNFLSPRQTIADALDAPSVARLREVKRTRDPHGVFRSNHPAMS